MIVQLLLCLLSTVSVPVAEFEEVAFLFVRLFFGVSLFLSLSVVALVAVHLPLQFGFLVVSLFAAGDLLLVLVLTVADSAVVVVMPEVFAIAP